MRIFVILLCLLFVASCAGAANQIHDLADYTRLPIPDGWQLEEIGEGYPYRIIKADSSAELLAFESIISRNLAVRSREEFRITVDSIIETVIMALPQPQMLINNGYYEGDRAWFVLEFLTLDSVNYISLWHRLQGKLFQQPDGNQILFTLWGRSPPSVSESVADDFKLMQDGFSYNGPVHADVFALSSSPFYWYAGAGTALLLALFYVRKRQQKNSSIEFSNQENVWRCSCGRMNHVGDSSCRRCGRIQVLDQVT